MPKPQPSAKPIRYVVLHRHQPTPEDQPVEVTVGYSTELPDGLYYAHNTARRYQGIVYADHGEGPGHYTFVRSYAPAKSGAKATPPVPTVPESV